MYFFNRRVQIIIEELHIMFKNKTSHAFFNQRVQIIIDFDTIIAKKKVKGKHDWQGEEKKKV